MDDRAKAVIVVVLAAATGIAGVLAAESLTGTRPGSAPASAVAQVDASGSADTLPPSSRPASPLPTTSRSPTARPRSTSTTKPTPSPTPARPWKPTWSKPRLVDKETCGAFSVGIDPRSRYHVVTSCGLRYSVGDAGGPWTTTTLGDEHALAPLIAFDRDQAYIAYWRELPYDPDTCGGDTPPPSAGVYYRWRTLPDGQWSKAIPFGERGDHLQAFRVDRGVLHAIVWNDTSNHTFYTRSTQEPVVDARYRIDADGDAALRIGDDGRARVAYWHSGSLLYATFDGSRFSTAKISDGPTDGPAMLVLGGGNQPHVAYTIVPPLAGLRRRGSTLSRWYVLRDDGERQVDFAPDHKGCGAFVLGARSRDGACPCPRCEYDVHP